MFQDTGGDILPACKTEAGCKIEDLAADEKLERKCIMFLTALRLYEATGLADTQREIFEQLGLLKDPDTLLELMMIYITFKNGISKGNQIQT